MPLLRSFQATIFVSGKGKGRGKRELHRHGQSTMRQLASKMLGVLPGQIDIFLDKHSWTLYYLNEIPCRLESLGLILLKISRRLAYGKRIKLYRKAYGHSSSKLYNPSKNGENL